MAKKKKQSPKMEWNYKENRATPVAPRSAAPQPSMIYDYEINRARPRTADDAYASPQAQGPISQDPKIQRGMAQTDRTLAQWESENDRRDRELVNQQFTVPQFHGKMYADPIDGATQSRLDAMSQPVSNGAGEFDPQSPRMRNLAAASARGGGRKPKVPVSQQTAPPLLPLPTYGAAPQRAAPTPTVAPASSPTDILNVSRGIGAFGDAINNFNSAVRGQGPLGQAMAQQPAAAPAAPAPVAPTQPSAPYTSAANAERYDRLKSRGMDELAIQRLMYPERFADLRAAAQQQVSQRGLVMGRPRPNRRS